MSGRACKMAYEQPKHEGSKLGTVEENPALPGLQLQTVTEKNLPCAVSITKVLRLFVLQGLDN